MLTVITSFLQNARERVLFHDVEKLFNGNARNEWAWSFWRSPLGKVSDKLRAWASAFMWLMRARSWTGGKFLRRVSTDNCLILQRSKFSLDSRPDGEIVNVRVWRVTKIGHVRASARALLEIKRFARSNFATRLNPLEHARRARRALYQWMFLILTFEVWTSNMPIRFSKKLVFFYLCMRISHNFDTDKNLATIIRKGIYCIILNFLSDQRKQPVTITSNIIWNHS